MSLHVSFADLPSRPGRLTILFHKRFIYEVGLRGCWAGGSRGSWTQGESLSMRTGSAALIDSWKAGFESSAGFARCPCFWVLAENGECLDAHGRGEVK